MKLTPHFTLAEMTKSMTALRKGIDNTPPLHIVQSLRILCREVLEPVRKHFETPFSPSSGYRSPELNAEVGGSDKSEHVLGEAVDFEVPGISNFMLALWIAENLEFGQLILECYTPGDDNSGWVHVSYSLDEEMLNRALTYDGEKYIEGLLYLPTKET